MANECLWLGVELSAYFDGESSYNKTLLVEKHVPTCVRCQKKLAEYDTLRTFLSGVEYRSDLQRILSEDVLTQLEYEEEPSS